MSRTAKPERALANAIRKRREERGLTREDLAFQSGVTVGSLARIELGQSAPAWGTVVQIARALEVPLEEIAREVEQSG